MESPSQDKGGAHVITIQPNETVLAAFPFRPHSSVLDFLKGEPKVLGGIQILLALTIVGLGTVLAFAYVREPEVFRLVFLLGYPFWGAFIFFLTGSVTVTHEKFKNIWIRGITTMNVISSTVAVVGIAIILICLTKQHTFCEEVSLEGSCGLGRTFITGILSILLIFTIAELGISVTIASFRSKCWTSSDEVVFFLPSDVTPNREQPAPEENTVLQFKLQEESSRIDRTSNRQTVFIGGYSFFKLRVCMEEGRISEDLNDKDLQYATTQSRQMQTQDQALPTKVFLAPPVQTLQALPVDDVPSQTTLIEAPPEPVMLYTTPSSHISQYLDLESEDLPSQDIPIQEKLSQETFFQETTSTQTTSQDIADNALSAPTTLSDSTESFKTQQLSQDLEPQNIQPQNQQSSEMLYADIRTEVMELTREWKSQEKHPRHFSLFHKTKDGKHLRRFSLELPRKPKISPRRYSLDLQSKGGQSLRRRSLDQKIKAWLSARGQPLSKQNKYTQTTELFPEQPDEDLHTRGKQPPKEQSKDGEEDEEQVIREQFPKTQTQVNQDEDQQAQKEKSPKEQSQTRQAKSPQVQMKKALKKMCHDWDSSSQEHTEEQFLLKQSLQWTKQNWQDFNQQYEDWRSQGWRGKDWMARDWQSERKESPKQKALYQEVPSQGTMAQYNLQRQFQGKDPKEFQPRVLKDRQIRSIKQGKPTNLQLEEMNSDFQPSSSQSLVQDTCLANIDSEQEVQQNASASSNSYKDLNVTSSSCGSKDQQQSEESD